MLDQRPSRRNDKEADRSYEDVAGEVDEGRGTVAEEILGDYQ